MRKFWKWLTFYGRIDKAFRKQIAQCDEFVMRDKIYMASRALRRANRINELSRKAV